MPSNEVVIDLVGLSEKDGNGLDVQLWPNPARGQAELVFELDSPQLVSLQLAGLAGQSVTILHQQYLAEGMHRIKLDADRLKPFAAGKVVVINWYSRNSHYQTLCWSRVGIRLLVCVTLIHVTTMQFDKNISRGSVP